MPSAPEGCTEQGRGDWQGKDPERAGGPGEPRDGRPRSPRDVRDAQERQGREVQPLSLMTTRWSLSSYSKGQRVRRGGQCISTLTHVLVQNPTGPGGPECPCPSGVCLSVPIPAQAGSSSLARDTWECRDAELAEQRGPYGKCKN